MAKEIKPSRGPGERVVRNLRPSWAMFNDMKRLSAASPGAHSCEQALVAYMIPRANLADACHSYIASARAREKGHVHTLFGTRESASKPVRIRGGWEVVSMKRARNDPRTSVTFD